MAKLFHLQGIRGVAICSVIAFHYFPGYFPNGYLGVDLFFVLSGYLMSMMLSRHTEINIPIIAEFLYRRVKRIVPLYYFVIAISIGAVYICPCTELINNMVSANNAIWLMTNIQWNREAGYFEKMGLSHDLFTHTWSLCLEMQFYLIFPLLWWLQMRVSHTKRLMLLHVTSGASLYLYFISNSTEAFNSMFCRIWQFLFEEDNQNSEECEKILLENEDRKIKKHKSSDWIFASLSLLLLMYTTGTTQHLTQNYSRMTTTLVSISLIYFGNGLLLLKITPLVFLGEVSYSWYLLHWPMLTLQKVYGYTSTHYLFLGIFLSFLAAVIVHYLLEKSYLEWSRKVIIAVVGIQLLACFGLHYGLDRPLAVCSATPSLITNISSLTLEGRKKYNEQFFDHDQYQLADNRCVFYTERKKPLFAGGCKYENPNPANNKTLLIVGNSWAANVSPLIFDECRNYFGNIYRAAHTACEVLMTENPWYCGEVEKLYFGTVERLKPDYLFLVQRYCFTGYVRPENEWEDIIKEGIKRLELLSAHVKEKIFVTHTFPYSYLNNSLLNDYLDRGTSIDWANVPWEEHPHDIPKAQEKLDQIFAKCSKCEQFDYTPQFLVNGTFYPYDPETIIPYITQGMHFTQPGLAKVRPVFTDICNKIGKQ